MKTLITGVTRVAMGAALLTLSAAAAVAHGEHNHGDHYYWYDRCCAPAEASHEGRRPERFVSPSRIGMAWSLYERGRFLANEHDLAAGGKRVEEALELLPKEAIFHYTLARIRRDQGQRDQAVEHFKAAEQYGDGRMREDARLDLRDLGLSSGDAAAATSAPAAGAASMEAGKVRASLYDRLGGEAALAAVVEEFTARVGADVRVNKFFAKTDMARFKKMLVQQLGQATGGPQKYEGGDMKLVHKDMGVSDANFDAIVDSLVGALNKFKVPAVEQKELLSILGPMRADIVEKKG